MQSLSRRHLLGAIPLALVACSAGAEQTASDARGADQLSSLPVLTVHKSPSCGCCGAWVDHVRAAGFEVRVIEAADTTPVARRLGVPDALRSCHTAEVGGYAIEGHVPAADIHRLLAERPDAAGLAVPGMPIGSPGMEIGDRHDPYQVIRFERAGETSVYASY